MFGRKLFLSVAGALILSSCSVILKTGAKDVNVNISSYNSFGLMDSRVIEAGDSMYCHLVTSVEKNLVEELLGYGFEFNQENPDFVVNVGITVPIKIQSEYMPSTAIAKFKASRLEYLNSYYYTEGYINQIRDPWFAVVDFIDTKTQKVMVYAVSDRCLVKKNGTCISQQEINDIIKRMISKFSKGERKSL